LRLFDAMLYSADFPEGFRAALRLRGFRTGVGRQPLSPGQQVDLQVLSDRLQCLLAEEGFSHEPLSGCPPKQSAADARQVDLIVRTVVAELQRRGLATE
jgi:4-hydroxy-tetrahydrodipicolinate synthase